MFERFLRSRLGDIRSFGALRFRFVMFAPGTYQLLLSSLLLFMFVGFWGKRSYRERFGWKVGSLNRLTYENSSRRGGVLRFRDTDHFLTPSDLTPPSSKWCWTKMHLFSFGMNLTYYMRNHCVLFRTISCGPIVVGI